MRYSFGNSREGNNYRICVCAQLLSGSYVRGTFQVKYTGVGCHFFLQGIFPTQGSNLSLLVSCISKQIHYQLRHLGSPKYRIGQDEKKKKNQDSHPKRKYFGQ